LGEEVTSHATAAELKPNFLSALFREPKGSRFHSLPVLRQGKQDDGAR
jgi:hypothetical protein